MRTILLTITAFALLGLATAGCTNTTRLSESMTPGSGATDEPAAGFANVRSGSEEDFIMTVGRRVYFSSGSEELNDVSRETLDLQANWLNQHPSWLVKLQGYADDPGASNVKLSDKRANTVMAYLASRGVSPQRMWAKGYGKERQVRRCPDISCKAQNRRVVVNLRKKFDAAAPQFAKAGG